MSPFELRLALKAKGYSSIPLMGKRPTLAEWQTKADATEEEMRRWSGPNTGLLTEFTPAFDIDITHPEAADAVEGAVRDWFDGRGIVPVRFGNAPKRAMLLRTAKPFPKIVAPFTDPAGNKHKIEVLGAGQQLAVHGIHPDAKVPWTWHSGTPWSEVPHSDLPEVDENEMRELLRFVSDLLVQEFGFEVLERGDGERAVGADDQPDRPVDVDAELADMTFLGGEVNGIHYTQLRCTAALLRSGVAIDDVVEQVFAATERAGSGQPWNWELERRGIRQMCGDFIVKNPELEDVLPPHAREQLRAVAAAGKRPKIVFSTQYNQWQVRGYGPSSDYDSSERRSYGKTEGDAPKGGGSFKLRPFVPFDPAALPPREWLYGRHYQRRTVSATVAPGGFGKTTLCMVEAVAMATTMNLLGEQPHRAAARLVSQR
jgi:AAA domain/Bifunctional DNA primase/polymerase, N-terminal